MDSFALPPLLGDGHLEIREESLLALVKPGHRT